MSSSPFENSNHGKARVIKKNLVYVIGLPQEIASEEVSYNNKKVCLNFCHEICFMLVIKSK